jgi:photosystem II stability/assembly factor-like uncharacterized protein
MHLLPPILLVLLPATQVVVRTSQDSGTAALLIAVSAVNDTVVWIAGGNRTFVRTTDGGATWHAGQVPIPDAPRLQFRDVHAVDANTAYLLSIGSGTDSRIFKTTDAGHTWTQQYVNRDSAAFYDCFDFWDERRGLVIGDEVGGEIMMLETRDGGATWARLRSPSLPPAIRGEGSFASSGTCLVTRPGGHAWVSTTKSRVLHTSDYGATWSVSTVPVSVADTTGVPSVSFRDDFNGMAFGGFGARASDTLVAVTNDGGATWTVRTRTPMRGGLWGGAYVPGTATPTAVAVGITGAAWSRDDGRTWMPIDTLNYWGIGFASPRAGWIVGTGGRIIKLSGFPE